MRTINIVGAGQGGLQLGLGLVKQKYSVTIYTNRFADQVLNGWIMSSQGMFNNALQYERKLGLNFWDAICPQNKAISFTLAIPGKAQKAIEWQGKTSKPYQSIDQRLKFSYWMKEFERLGGKLVVQDVGIDELNKIAKWSDLTIVAGGKGEISQCFPRNNIRSHFQKPQRVLACLYVHDVVPAKLPGVRANVIPEVGEYFIMPGLTKTGPCEMMLFEGIPGGPFDCWKDIASPEQRLEKAKALLKTFVPWEAERCHNAKLTDNQATLTGAYTPTIRQPTFKLACGKFVLGLGDTVVLNDPAAGQGANNASKGAQIYMERIIGKEKAPFDKEWMQDTFEMYWKECAKWATKWTHMLLTPPQPHVIELLSAAARTPTIADILADGFDDPSTLFPWITHPEDTRHLISSIEAEVNLQKVSSEISQEHSHPSLRP